MLQLRGVFVFCCIVFHYLSFAQSNRVGVGTLSPNASSLLDLTATDKGFLMLRITDTNNIVSPATGLLIYLTTKNTFYYFDGTYWRSLRTQSGLNDATGSTGTTGTNGNTGATGLSGIMGFTGNSMPHAGFRAILTTPTSAPATATYTTVAFQNEVIDDAGTYTPFTGVYTAPSSGRYFFQQQGADGGYKPKCKYNSKGAAHRDIKK